MKITCSTPHNGVFFAGELFTCFITLTNQEKKPTASQNNVQATATTLDGEKKYLDNEKNQSIADSGSITPSFLRGFLRGFLNNSFSNPTSVQSPTKDADKPFKEASKNQEDQQDMENESVTSVKPPLPPPSSTSHLSFSKNQDQSASIEPNITASASLEKDKAPEVPPIETGGRINMDHPNLNDTSGMINQRNTNRHSRTFSNTPTIDGDFDSYSQIESPDRTAPSIDPVLPIKEENASNAPLTETNRIKLNNLIIQTSFNRTNGSIEKIAMGFAQISGQFTLDPHYIKKESFAGLKDRVLYKIPGTQNFSKGPLVYGGGSLSTFISHHEKSIKPINDALPLYNTPPTILFCDLTLGVGESKTFKYEILLPAVLPPSHRGKMVRFQYKLVIGIQNDVTNAATRVISVPFRFFNRTNVDGSRPVFELLNPVIHSKDQAMVVSVESQDISNSPQPSTSFIKTSQLIDLEKRPRLTDSNQSLRSSVVSRLESEFETLSADNVMNVLQMSGKVSYDICKNNEHIAQLVMGRLGYRLGESVTAVLNFTKSTVPCFHVSVFLEVHELVEAQFAARSKELIKQHTRICVGEFHQRTINSKRTAIVLNIPSKATPDFQTSAISNVWSLRFEFITGTGSPILSEMAQFDGFQHQRSVHNVNVEPFDCTIPLKVYGALKTSKQHKRVLEFEL